jgi:hypothetical protein
MSNFFDDLEKQLEAAGAHARRRTESPTPSQPVGAGGHGCWPALARRRC